MLTIIHTWNSLLTKLPGEHQPSLPAQRAQVLPQQGPIIFEIFQTCQVKDSRQVLFPVI